VRAHLRIEAVAIHAEVKRRLTEADDTRQQPASGFTKAGLYLVPVLEDRHEGRPAEVALASDEASGSSQWSTFSAHAKIDHTTDNCRDRPKSRLPGPAKRDRRGFELQPARIWPPIMRVYSLGASHLSKAALHDCRGPLHQDPDRAATLCSNYASRTRITSPATPGGLVLAGYRVSPSVREGLWKFHPENLQVIAG
jgi:hypothetical protein